MKMRPLGERVIVKAVTPAEVTKGGIVLPDAAQEKNNQAEVLAVGPGRLTDEGQRVAPEVQVGDKIIYAKFTGTEVKIDGEEYVILNGERDILAVIE